jgi:hypothetical protein
MAVPPFLYLTKALQACQGKKQGDTAAELPTTKQKAKDAYRKTQYASLYMLDRI